MHIGLRRNPRRNLVMCLIPLLLYQLYVLLGEGLIICRILFLKVLRLFEKKVMFEVKTGYIV